MLWICEPIPIRLAGMSVRSCNVCALCVWGEQEQLMEMAAVRDEAVKEADTLRYH
jgi:hypothetical protein